MAPDPLVVIFGSDGMLGTALMREVQCRGLRHHLYGRDVDITAAAAVYKALEPVSYPSQGFSPGPAIIINAAAWTHVDACEQDPKKAFACNAWGARVIAQASINWRPESRLVHVSTGAVFDGIEAAAASRFSRPGYDEFEPVRPTSVYAKTKWAGEELVRQVCPKALVVRLGHLYGPGGKNGLSTARKRLVAGERFSINDHCRIAPTYVADAARGILDAIGKDVFGTTLHVAPEGATTAWGFAARLAAKLGLSTDKTLVVGDSLRYPNGPDGLGKKILAATARRDVSVLAHDLAWRNDFQLIRSSVLDHHGITPIGPWEEGLDRYLTDEASS